MNDPSLGHDDINRTFQNTYEPKLFMTEIGLELIISRWRSPIFLIGPDPASIRHYSYQSAGAAPVVT